VNREAIGVSAQAIRICRGSMPDGRTAQASKKPGERPMTRADITNARPTQRSPGEWAKLIHKLRWIGLEDEARSLQLAVSTLPVEERGAVSAEPPSTD
jgi:hypothetical protein